MSGAELPPVPFALTADVEWLRDALKGHRHEMALERLITCVSLQQLALETARRTELDAIAGDSSELAEAIAETERLGPHRRAAEPDRYAEPRCPEADCALEESHDGAHRFKCAGQFCCGFPYRASEKGHPVFCATGTETIHEGTSMEDVAAAAHDASRVAMPPLPEDYEPFPGSKCDNCDRPATQLARDLHERFDPTAMFQDYDPGPTKYGCSDHPVGSKMIAAGHAEMMAAIAHPADDEDDQP